MTLLRTALRHRVVAPNIETGFEQVAQLSQEPLEFSAFCAAVSTCLADGLIREPVRLPEGALQCHWRLELTPEGVQAAREAVRWQTSQSQGEGTQRC